MNYPTLRLFKERLWRWLIKNERNLRKIEKGCASREWLNPHFPLGSQVADHFTGSPKANMESLHVGNDNDNCTCLSRECWRSLPSFKKTVLAGYHEERSRISHTFLWRANDIVMARTVVAT